ncbi:MAG: ABC transporter permease [Coriobacteriia bacterium]|nr:ABC transporter permease [Coriobacteriia bacterium]
MSWRRIRLLIWKEFTQLSRDRSMLPILFIMPIVMLLMFGYVVGSDIKDLKLAVLDNDHTVQSQQVVDAYVNSSYFTVAARPQTEAQLKQVMDGSQAIIAIDIPKGLGDAVRQHRSAQIGVIVDGSDSRTSQVAMQYSSGIISSLSGKFFPQPGGLSAGGVNVQTRIFYNPTLRAVNTMVPALLAFILMMSTTNIMAQAIVKERERGTLEQLFVTPIGRTDYLVGKVLPYVCVAAVQVVITFVVGVLWFQVPFDGSLILIGCGLLLFMLSALGIGMLISLVSRTRQQAQQTSQLMQMPQMMLSGFMFPIAAFPTWLYYLTFLIPLRYILVIVRSNFLKGSTFMELWPQFLAMALFSIGIFILGLSRFQKRLAD